jgi:hypothetical protein
MKRDAAKALTIVARDRACASARSRRVEGGETGTGPTLRDGAGSTGLGALSDIRLQTLVEWPQGCMSTNANY